MPQTLIAFGAVALLGLLLRIFFGRGRDTVAVAWPSTAPGDFGLLAPAAVVDSAADAAAYRDRLASAGIRATTAVTADGRHQILVFRSELDRARQLGNTP